MAPHHGLSHYRSLGYPGFVLPSSRFHPTVLSHVLRMLFISLLMYLFYLFLYHRINITLMFSIFTNTEYCLSFLLSLLISCFALVVSRGKWRRLGSFSLEMEIGFALMLRKSVQLMRLLLFFTFILPVGNREK